ncbi:MAG TPA: dihydrofolate reductase family protein [Terriglobales bacterium]|jgi:riboflavin biosynthesis pyrimidine reductase|nr:dihydrofolate reductase family protein [Terriglobales bacterium]
MQHVRTLFDSATPGEPLLPAGLRELYDGNLNFPDTPTNRPYVIGNFVSTIDGIVSYRIPRQSGGGTISGSDDADRFIMGLLRSSVDAVVVGSRTVHEVSAKHLWIAEFIYPDAKEMYIDWRVNVLRKSRHPLAVVVTGTGKLELHRAVFRTPDVPVLIVTTEEGQRKLERSGATNLQSVQVMTLAAEHGSVSPAAILQLLHSKFGIRTVLHEGGPNLFGKFVSAALVDELFLTISPQIAGRVQQTIRPGLVEGIEFLPEAAPWLSLLSAKQKADHLYLRYRARESARR